jgi:4-carboxymuconolactone decarboxylase
MRQAAHLKITKTGEVSMARIEPIPLDDMTAEQRRLHDKISAQRTGGEVRGPFAVLLHVPEIAEPVADMVDLMLSDTRVPHTLKELAILTIARQYTAQYEWGVHVRRALRLGLDEAVIDAIRHNRRPDFRDADEELVYDMTNELVADRRLGDDHYARAVAALGEAALVELVALIGFYMMVAILLVSYQVELPDGIAETMDEVTV